jgi:hypothetical protein
MFSQTTMVLNPVLSSLVIQAVKIFLKMCPRKVAECVKNKILLSKGIGVLVNENKYYGLLGYYRAFQSITITLNLIVHWQKRIYLYENSVKLTNK